MNILETLCIKYKKNIINLSAAVYAQIVVKVKQLRFAHSMLDSNSVQLSHQR